MKYKQEVIKEGRKWTDWIQPIKKGYKMCCCDCGLVHNMNFRIFEGRIQFQVNRNNRATGQKRRNKTLKYEQ